MASLTGVKGSFTATLSEIPVINIYEWNADIARDVFDDSYFDGDMANARTKVGGMAVLTGTARGYANAAETTAPGIGSMATENAVTGGVFKLIVDDSTTPDEGYTFTGLLTELTVDVVKTQLVAVSLRFQSLGAVTLIA